MLLACIGSLQCLNATLLMTSVGIMNLDFPPSIIVIFIWRHVLCAWQVRLKLPGVLLRSSRTVYRNFPVTDVK